MLPLGTLELTHERRRALLNIDTELICPTNGILPSLSQFSDLVAKGVLPHCCLPFACTKLGFQIGQHIISLPLEVVRFALLFQGGLFLGIVNLGGKKLILCLEFLHILLQPKNGIGLLLRLFAQLGEVLIQLTGSSFALSSARQFLPRRLERSLQFLNLGQGLLLGAGLGGQVLLQLPGLALGGTDTLLHLTLLLH